MKFKLFARLKKKAGKKKPKTTSFNDDKTNYNELQQQQQAEPNSDDSQIKEIIKEQLAKGISENEIIDYLRGAKYDFVQIDRTMTKILQEMANPNQNAQLNNEAFNQNIESAQNYNNTNNNIDNINNNYNNMPEKQNMENIQTQTEKIQDPLLEDQNMPAEQGLNIEEVEEIVNEMLTERFDKIYDFENKTKKAIEEIKKTNEEISNKNEENKKKTDLFEQDYKKQINDVNDKISKITPKIESLQKAFKDIVPNLAEDQKAIKMEFEDIKQKIKTKK